jgi:hypothetical protein
VAVALFCGAHLASAQESARLSGKVTDADGAPLAGAQIYLPGGSLGTLSGPGGRYELSAIPHGAHVVVVELIGFRKLQLSLELPPGAAIERDIQLEVDPVPLEDVRVTVPSSRSPRLAGFYQRRERGVGYYYTQDDVKSSQARLFTDILRRVPGARVQTVQGPFGTTHVVQLGRTTGLSRSCPLLYYMNGTPFRLGADADINDYVAPDDIAGVEVYTGTSRIPAAFNSGPNDARCGVVVIWTRDGSGPR